MMTRYTAVATATAAALPTSAAAIIAPAGGFTLRPAEERGRADHGWLRSAHSFSFGQYYHPDHMGFESLRVINDDWVAGGGGFPPHPHRDAEIFSYVLDGALEHKDSMGNGSVVQAGGVQYMSAGSGVTHSEFNPSQTEPMAFFQIWLMPNVRGAAPRYDTLDIAPEEKDGRFKLFLSPDGRDGSMAIRADADIRAATLDGEQVLEHDMSAVSKGWVQVVRGNVAVNGQPLRRGDGLAIRESGRLSFTDGDDAEIIYFEFLDV